MNDRQLARLLADTIELLDRSRPALPARLQAMTDAMNGHPRSGALDAGAPGKTTFCEIHEKERCECGAGTPFANLSDPTGESAARPDFAASDRAALERALRSIATSAGTVVNLLARYTPRPATDKERRESLDAGDRDVACWSCARTEFSKGVRRWERAARTAEVAGVRRPLCWWCFDWLRKGDGKLPAPADIAKHHDGARVRKPA